MQRTWTDRDDVEWTIEAIPLQQEVKPGERIPMFGETPYHLWFRAGGTSHRIVVPPEVGSRFLELTDSELQAILDEEGTRHVTVHRGK